MKQFASFFLLFGLFSLPVFAAENIVCALKDSKNPQRFISVKLPIQKQFSEDWVRPAQGLDIGRDNYNFDLLASWNEQNPKLLNLDVTFYENNHVQDEVASYSWTVDLSTPTNGKPILTEPLSEEGKVLMNFVCYYNR
jgi:hypothetical protein